VMMNPCLVSSDHAFEEIVTTNGILWRYETLLTVFRALWSSDSASGIHRTRTLLKPNFWIILKTVPCERSKSCSSSLTVTLLLSRTADSTRVLFLGVPTAVGLPILSLSFIPTWPDLKSEHHFVTLRRLINSSP
jgi:hypothetical protein